jgi:hypothetical protein
MNILSVQESQVFELIRAGIQPSDIAKRPEYRKRSSLYTTIQRLTSLGYLEKNKSEKHHLVSYRTLISEYEVVEGRGIRARRSLIKHPVLTTIPDEPFNSLIVSKEQKVKIFELCIRGEKTSMISHTLRLPRYIVNKEIINMGIEQDN